MIEIMENVFFWQQKEEKNKVMSSASRGTGTVCSGVLEKYLGVLLTSDSNNASIALEHCREDGKLSVR